MDKMTRDALEASIKHWQQNVDAETPDVASCLSEDCALCQAFPYEFCDGCPVSEKTGMAECGQTPYLNALLAWIDWKLINSADNLHAFRAAAQAELDFLTSLRPSEDEDAMLAAREVAK